MYFPFRYLIFPAYSRIVRTNSNGNWGPPTGSFVVMDSSERPKGAQLGAATPLLRGKLSCRENDVVRRTESFDIIIKHYFLCYIYTVYIFSE